MIQSVKLTPTRLTPSQSLSVTFSSEKPSPSTSEKSPSAKVPQRESRIKNFLKGFFTAVTSKLSIVYQPFLKSGTILKEGFQWNDAFKDADPASSTSERMTHWIDLSLAVFEESVRQSLFKTASSQSSFSFVIYELTLNRFPALLKKHASLPNGFDIVRKAIETKPDLTLEQRTMALKNLEEIDYSLKSIEECRIELKKLLNPMAPNQG